MATFFEKLGSLTGSTPIDKQDNDPQFAMIDSFLIDACISESHEYKSEITKFPVERGGTITDNIRNEPLTVTMECIISNTPIGKLAQQFSSAGRSDFMYQRLLEIRAARKPVTIRTSLKKFNNMALESLSIPRGKGGGDFLRFTAVFVQIDIVDTDRSIRTADPMGHGSTKTTKSPFLQPGKKPVAVDTVNGIWFDPAISAWRHFARYTLLDIPAVVNLGLNLDVNTGLPFNGKRLWTLEKDRPTTVTVQQWAAIIPAPLAPSLLIPRQDVPLRKYLHPLGQVNVVPQLGPGVILVAPADYQIRGVNQGVRA